MFKVNIVKFKFKKNLTTTSNLARRDRKIEDDLKHSNTKRFFSGFSLVKNPYSNKESKEFAPSSSPKNG